MIERRGEPSPETNWKAPGNPGRVNLTEGQSFESTAAFLDIPPENRNHPAVREFAVLFGQAQELQQHLSVAASRHSPAYSCNGQRLAGESLASSRELLGAPDANLTLAGRYEAAELLMRGAIHILKEGTGIPATDFRGYLAGKVNAALARFGLRVSRVGPGDHT